MKKFSAYELEGFSKLAARLYLENKIPLNETIEKISRENELNYDQTSRIVEESNTGVYIDLFNRAKPGEKYIEFKTASIKDIWSKVHPTDTTMKTSDYATPPEKSHLNISSKQKDEFSKIASHEEETFEGPTSKSHAETLQRIHEKALDERIKNAQLELELVIDRVVSSLTKEARQSILSEDSTSAEISFAVKHALSDPRYEKIATYIISQLPKTKKSTEKVAGILDTSHEFYQNLQKLGQLIDVYVESHKNPKESLEKIAGAMKMFIIVPAGLFGAAALSGAYKAGKIHGEASTSVTRDPSLYTKIN